MLNYLSKLVQAVELKDFEVFINGLKPFAGSQWDYKCDEMKQFKKDIHEKLERYQKRRCAYCGLEYTEVAYTNIEHIIAPKKIYPQFMFEPFNLVASCPYLDDPDEHFEFINNLKGIIIRSKSSKDSKSIEIFELNGGYMLEQRAKQFVSMNTTSAERYRQISDILVAK